MGIGMLREQPGSLTRDRRNAFMAAWLGWAIDAFDALPVVIVPVLVAVIVPTRGRWRRRSDFRW